MNILLWILQILLALHTLMGAIWKFSNPAQTIPSLKAISHSVWVAMSIIELLCCLGLVLPVLNKHLGILAPVAATFIVAEMLFFTGMFISSGNSEYGQLFYWLVVAAFSAFIAYGRLSLRPF